MLVTGLYADKHFTNTNVPSAFRNLARLSKARFGRLSVPSQQRLARRQASFLRIRAKIHNLVYAKRVFSPKLAVMITQQKQKNYVQLFIL